MNDAEKIRRAVDHGEYVEGVAPLLAAEVRRLQSDMDSLVSLILCVGRPAEWLARQAESEGRIVPGPGATISERRAFVVSEARTVACL